MQALASRWHHARHRLLDMADLGEPLFPAFNASDCVPKFDFDYVYGRGHSLPDGIMRFADRH